MSTALTSNSQTRTDDSLLSAASPRSPPAVSDSNVQEGTQPDPAGPNLSGTAMDNPGNNLASERPHDPEIPVPPGTISDEGSNPSGDPGDIVMEGTAEPEDSQAQHLSDDYSGEQGSTTVVVEEEEEEEGGEEEFNSNRGSGTQQDDLNESGLANEDPPEDEDDDDDAHSDASSDYEHRFFLESFQEDTSVPTEDEVPEMERRKGEEVSALDGEHWTKVSFTHLSANTDPEYEILPDVHQLKWTMKPYHGNKENPNRDSFTRSPSITVENHDGRKYCFGLKVFPHGNDGTEMVSVYLECFPEENRPQTPSNHDVSGTSDDDALVWWELAAQVGCVMYNPKEPRVFASQKAAHQFTARNPDFGWTRFTGPWNEIHKRKHLSYRPLLQEDEVAFTVYIRLVKDSTQALWWHNLRDRENDWDPLLKTGYRGLHVASQPNGYSAIISALAVWFELPAFRALVESATLPDLHQQPSAGYQPLMRALKIALHDKQAPRWSNEPSKQIVYLDSVYTALSKHGYISLTNPIDVWTAIRRVLEIEVAEFVERGNGSKTELSSFFESLETIPFSREPNFPTCQDLDDSESSQKSEPTTHDPASLKSAQGVLSQAKKCDKSPEILQVELPRQFYDAEKRCWSKVTSKIDIDEEVAYQEAQYQLFGIISHSGELGNVRFNPILRPRGPGTRWLRWSTRCNHTTRGVVVPQTFRQAIESLQGSGTSTTVAYILIYIRVDAIQSIIASISDRASLDVYNPLPKLPSQLPDQPDEYEVAVHFTDTFAGYKSSVGFIDVCARENTSINLRFSKSDTIFDLRDKLSSLQALNGKYFNLYRLRYDNMNHYNYPQVREERLENRIYTTEEATFGTHFLLHILEGENAEAAQKQVEELERTKAEDLTRDIDGETENMLKECMEKLQPPHDENIQQDPSSDIPVPVPFSVAEQGETQDAQVPEHSNAAVVEEDTVMSGTEEAERISSPVPMPAPAEQSSQADQDPPIEQMQQDSGSDNPQNEQQDADESEDQCKADSQKQDEPPNDAPKRSTQLLEALKLEDKGFPVQIYSLMSDMGREAVSKSLSRPLSLEEATLTFAARYKGDHHIYYFSLLNDPTMDGPKVGSMTLMKHEHLKAETATLQKPENLILIFVKHYWPSKGPALESAGAMLVKRDSLLKDIIKRPSTTNDIICYLELPGQSISKLQQDLTFMQNDIYDGSVIITDPVMPELMATTLTKRGLPSSAVDFLKPKAGFSDGFGKGWASCEMQNGRAHGSGRIIYPNGDAYEGSLVSGCRQGKGTMYYTTGNSYRGDWKDNEPEGNGIIVYAQTRNKYEGPFKDGRPHGSGGVTYWKQAEAGARICRVCLMDEMNAVLIPCGHMVMCTTCGGQVSECPICRGGIDRVQRVYDCTQV